MIKKSTFAVLVVGVVASLAIGIISLLTRQPVSETMRQLGGTVENFPYWFTNGMTYGDGVTHNIRILTLGAGVDHVCYNNNSGRVQYVDVPSLDTTATTTGSNIIASSSFLGFMGTTTQAMCSATNFNPYLSPGASASVAGLSPTTSLIYLPIATTTGFATTSNSWVLAKGGSQGEVPVQNGEAVILGLVKNASTTPVPCTPGTMFCESATSTNRGFNLRAILRILFVP